jgi:hypothetical protein
VFVCAGPLLESRGETGSAAIYIARMETRVARSRGSAWRHSARWIARVLEAEHAGPGSAEVWICAYKASTSAFDAVQRARAEAQAVKFQRGPYLVLAKWNDVPKASLTALVRAIQKAVPTR